MEIFEEAVLAYICAAPRRFVKPQYALKYEDGTGYSCPDFVVIYYVTKTIYIVEVKTAADASTILSRIRERETRWYIPMKREMSQWSETFSDWKYRVTLFVRKSLKNKVKLEGMNDVFVVFLEDITFPWGWDWNGQLLLNPLERYDIAQNV